jgi:hypothetical protein
MVFNALHQTVIGAVKFFVEEFNMLAQTTEMTLRRTKSCDVACC